MTKIIRSFQLIFASWRYRTLSITSFISFLTLYLFTLPATYTGGRVGLVSLRLLTPKLAFFAVALAALIGFILTLMVYSLRQSVEQSKAATAGGVLGSVLPPLLCCSPILPSIAALFGSASPVAFGVSGFIQGFIATYETYIYTAIILVLMLSLYRGAKRVIQCAC